MTEDKEFKRLVRARAQSRGQSYAAARRQLLTPEPVDVEAGPQLMDWIVAGSAPWQYSHELIPGERYEGNPVARLTYTASDAPDGFGTTLQKFYGAEFIGHGIRFAGVLRVHEVDGWAGLWMRVDGAAGGPALSFDNMDDRALTGTTDWARCELVVVAPEGTSEITFGTVLVGRGSVAIANLSIDKVDQSVPLTGAHIGELTARDYGRLAGPRNLDFSELAPHHPVGH